jgi:hypothetical protein
MNSLQYFFYKIEMLGQSLSFEDLYFIYYQIPKDFGKGLS